MQPARRRCCAWLLAAGVWPAARANVSAPGATAETLPELAADLPLARVQGSGRLRFMGLRVYDARLWAEGSAALGDDWPARPFALELQYARALKGALIAERSLEEMRRQGELPAATARDWLARMQQLFPDVQGGDRITGLHRPGDGVRFWLNGRALGDLPGADFARRFFGIWLAPQTSEPTLRAALLGRGTP